MRCAAAIALTTARVRPADARVQRTMTPTDSIPIEQSIGRRVRVRVRRLDSPIEGELLSADDSMVVIHSKDTDLQLSTSTVEAADLSLGRSGDHRLATVFGIVAGIVSMRLAPKPEGDTAFAGIDRLAMGIIVAGATAIAATGFTNAEHWEPITMRSLAAHGASRTRGSQVDQ